MSFNRGWVYVMSNIAMPGLVKVGFTMKDPEMRADELNHTGSPYRPVVEYDVLVTNPQSVEQRTHKKLKSYHESKEWFRCSIDDAVVAIKSLAGDSIISERFPHRDAKELQAIISAKIVTLLREFASPNLTFEQKIDKYTEIINLNPKYAFAYRRRGETYKDEADKGGAEGLYQKAIDDLNMWFVTQICAWK